MKKSLIALAALAAVTAASAQSTVSINGKFGYSYIQSTTNAGVKANGFSATDGDVNFVAVEDLGGGLKAEVFMGIRLRGREVNADTGSSTAVGDQADGIGARNSTVSLTGGFGQILAGAVASGSGILARGSVGAAFQGLDHDSTLIDAEVNGVDLFQYTTPTVSGFNAYVQVVDSIGDPGAGGAQAAATVSSATVVGVNYSNGPLSANLDTTSFARNASTATNESRVRVSAMYNLGVANLGFGYQTNDNTLTDVTQYVVGVAVPVGAWTFALNAAGRDTTTLATNAKVTNTGYEAGVNYAFSKRTSLSASYRTVNEGATTIDQKSTRVRLMHSF